MSFNKDYCLLKQIKVYSSDSSFYENSYPCNIKIFQDFIKKCYENDFFNLYDNLIYEGFLNDYCRGYKKRKLGPIKIKLEILIEYDAKNRNLYEVLSNFILILIRKKWGNYGYTMEICKYEILKEIYENYFVFNTDWIVNILTQYYKNQKGLGDDDLNNIIKKEKSTILNGKDLFGNTPLMIACKLKCTKEEIIKYLIDKGADVNAKNKEGDTPLMLTCKKKWVNKEIIKYLIEKGADVNAKNNKGNTPLLLTCKKNYINEEVFNYLIEHGADVNAKNKNGETALILARNNCHLHEIFKRKR